MNHSKISRRNFVVGSGALLGAGLITACAPATQVNGGQGSGSANTEATLQGDVKVDGSSTVFPISEAVAEEFIKEHPKVRVTVGVSGTGGGFKKLCADEIDISDASREIKEPEQSACSENSVEYIELAVAFDGLSVMVHPSNEFVDHLTTEELKSIWEPNSKINSWKEVRAGFPDLELKLYGPGADSGTFDYFTEVIMGRAKASRPDFTASEDDNVLVRGISGDKGSLGYFGYAYYVENKNSLKLVPIDDGSGAVLPTADTINNGSYSPLSRPLFIYVSISSLRNKPQVREFVTYYLTDGAAIVPQVGYIQLTDDLYAEGLASVEASLE